MLIRYSLIAGLALILVPAAMGGGPGDVYNDYATDGALSCSHPRSDLEAVLKDATLNQYGDPYTMAGLKLAIRRQLAGGCTRSAATNKHRGAATTDASPASGTQPAQAKQKRTTTTATAAKRVAAGDPGDPIADKSGGGHGMGLILLAVLLLLLALTLGGWAARKAFDSRP
jgi:hypothetical protein